MQVKNVVQKILALVTNAWPNKIIYKLAIANVIVLTMSIGGYALYTVVHNNKKNSDFTIQQHKSYAKQIAAIYVNDSETLSKIKLQEKIKTLMPIIGEHVVSIKNAKYNSVISLKYENNDIKPHIQNIVPQLPPTTDQDYQFVRNGFVEMWHPFQAGEFKGWVYFRIAADMYNFFSMEFLKQSISVTIFSVLLSLLWLKKIMHNPLATLARASEFAEWLDMAQGNHLQVKTNSKEVEQLVHSLNHTSEKLFRNEQTIKSNHLLVDTVRDVQTQYIEYKSSNDLYINILSKLVQLSESEYGFIGEVLTNDTGKQYIKMHAFSNVNQTLARQRFYENNAPPNLEFHNSHNLFGAVLQTRKPTIANDAARDPRSGGLPAGHPPIYSFLGLPIFNKEELVGVVGLANRRKAYDQGLIAYLQPLLNTIGHIIAANKRNLNHLKVQQQLEQKEVLFRTILATVSDSVITINAGGFIETINPATENLFGYFKEILITLSINQLIPGLFESDFRTKYTKNQKPESWEREGLRKDGSTFPIEFTVSEFKIGAEQLFTVTIRDITHRRQVESMFRRTEASLLQVQEIAHLGSWELNVDTQYITATNEVYSIFDFRSYGAPIKFNDLVDKVYKTDRAQLRSAIELALTNKKPFTKEVRVGDVDSGFKYVVIHGHLQANDGVKPKILTGTIQDVTTTRQLIKRKDEFISSVSEEIRSPLTSIRGSIGLLAGEVTHHITDRERALLENAYKNTDRLLVLINDILEIENIETGKTELDFELLEFDNLLEQVLYAREQDQERYNIHYKLVSVAPDVVLVGDKYRLSQVLNILMSNAAKHSPVNGLIEISASLSNGMLNITVKDDGDGIPEAMQKEVFDIYARTKNMHAASNESTGFGLCIAKSIIERHNGVIEFESSPGMGTTFHINLPVPQQNVAVLK